MTDDKFARHERVGRQRAARRYATQSYAHQTSDFLTSPTFSNLTYGDSLHPIWAGPRNSQIVANPR